jgi:amino acid transporter
MNPMILFDILINITWVYLIGAVIVGGFYSLVYLGARRNGRIESDSPVLDIAITAALWPAFIAFMINKMMKRPE